MGAPAAEIAGQGVEVDLPFRERIPQLLRTLGQCARSARRQRNHEPGLRCQRHRPDPRLRRTVLAYHAVPVGSPEPERIDADGDRAIGERLALGLHVHGTALEIDLRVRHQEVPRDRRKGAPLHHQEDLEQGAVEGRGFHVPHVALHRCQPERHGSIEAAEGFRDRVAFDAVAHHGAGRMRFDVVEVPRCTARAGAGRTHQLDLRVTGRRGDVAPLRQAAGAVGGARGIDRGPLQHAVDGVSVPLGRRERLDREREGSLGTHVPVRFRVERVALAVGADDSQGVEGCAQPRCSEVVDGPHDGLLAVAAHERVDGRVQGGEAGGTRRAVGDGRPHQVEVVGNAIGQHRETDGGHVERAGAVHRPPARHRRHLGADEDSGGAVAQRVQVPADPLEGLPRAGQQHPQLRVRHHHLVLRHSEQSAVEKLLPVVADQSLPGARESARTGESANRPVAPAVPVGDRLLDDFPFAEQAPEVVVGADAARHAVAVSRDGDFHAGIRCVHFRYVLSAASSTPRERVNSLCTHAGRAFGSLPQSRNRLGPNEMSSRGHSRMSRRNGYTARQPAYPIPICSRCNWKFSSRETRLAPVPGEDGEAARHSAGQALGAEEGRSAESSAHRIPRV